MDKNNELDIRRSFNGLMRSKKNKKLPLLASKLELYLITSDYDDDARSRVFTRNEILSCGISKSHYTRELKYAIESLKDYEVSFQTKNSVLNTRLLSADEFHDDGTVELFFEPKLKPYLIALKKDFTLFSFKVALGLEKSKHSLDLYKFFESHLHYRESDIGKSWDLENVDFLDLLQVCGFDPKPKSTYYRYRARFIAKFLMPAIEELNETSNIHIEITKEVKEKRKIIALDFKLTRQKYSDPLLLPQHYDDPTEPTDIIPESIHLICEEIGYLLTGKSKSLIDQYISSNSAEHVLKALEKIKLWPDKKFQAKMVKSLLPIYLKELAKKEDLLKELSTKKVSEEKQEQLLKIKQNKMSAAWDEFKILESVSYEYLLKEVQKSSHNKDSLTSDQFVETMAKSLWLERFYK